MICEPFGQFDVRHDSVRLGLCGYHLMMLLINK